MYNFEKLTAWKRAMDLVSAVYEFTAKLPSQERFAICDQLRRAASSIPLNIAEGSGAKSTKEFSAFTRHSLKSLYETITGLKIIERIYEIPIEKELERCDEVSRLLHGLLKHLETKNSKL